MTLPSSPNLNIRGHRAIIRPAPIGAIALAALFDLAWALAVIAGAIRGADLSPVPNLVQSLALILAVIALIALQLVLLKGTVGMVFWKMRIRNAKIIQTEKPDPSSVALATLTSITLFAAAASFFKAALWDHPLHMKSETLNLPAFSPPAEETAGSGFGATRWSVRSFYYALGAWPARFSTQAVLYSIPYQKGPPQQFLGRFVARWDAPQIRVTFEGPKTPTRSQEGDQPIDPARVQLCIAPRAGAEVPADLSGITGSIECLRIREAALMRHLREMRAAVRASEWQMRWFEVENPAIPANERPRGIHLIALSESSAQERYVFINAKGTHQAVILDRARNDAGDEASKLLREAVRSQRIFAALEPGKAWANRELADTRLQELEQISGTEDFAARIGQIQSLLISKISVEPASANAYLHLGGTSLLLLRRAVKTGNTDWTAVARPNLQSALKYAEDLNADLSPPGASQTVDELSRMWKLASEL